MRRFWAIMMLALTVAGLVACGSNYSWNQKLTVTVETPEGIKTGSAVTRVSAKVGGQSILSQAIVSYRVEGEATFVDLGNGKYLFALLSSGGDYTPTEYWAQQAFRKQILGDPEPYREEKARLSELFTKLQTNGKIANVPLDEYPLLVTFADLNDPKSVKAINPINLPATFGQGYRLKSITIEITDENVTEGQVEKLLVWLESLQGMAISEPLATQLVPFPTQNLYPSAFIKGN
jgi:hypothetical protein